MAILMSDWLDQQRKKDDGTDTSVPPIIGSGAETSAPNAGSSPQGATQAPTSTGQPPQTGTGFINLSDYVNANKGSATQMANQLGAGVEKAGQDATKGLTDIQGQYAQQTSAGTVSPYGTATGPLARGGTPDGRGSPTPTTSGWGVVNPMSGQTVSQPGDPTLQAAADTAKQTYSGPHSLSDLSGFQSVSDNARTASEQAGQLGSFTGRQTLLQDNAKGPYSRGSSLLDSYLTGAAGGQHFADLGKQYGNLPDTVSKANADTSLADNAQATSTSNASQAQRYLDDRVKQRDDADAGRQTSDQTAEQYRAAQSHYQIGFMTPEQFAALSPQQRERWARGDPNGFQEG